MSKNILLYVSGSISCFKSCSLISLLKKDDYNVKVIASQNALKFVGKASFEGLSKNKLITDLFEDSQHIIPHIELAQNWADIIVAYPASASFINKAAFGLADDLIGSVLLANNYKKPVLIAPGMNTQMFEHPATQKAIKTLQEWGTQFIFGKEGTLACGTIGKGRLCEAEEAFNKIKEILK